MGRRAEEGCGASRTRTIRTIEPGSGKSGSWSEGIFGREPADVDEVAAAATWTAPRFGGDGGALVGDRRRSCAFEFQEEACLSGVLTFGRMPKAKIADLVQAFGQNVLEETANEFVAWHAAGAPAR